VITAIYPGTYDPVTNGHVDVIKRAARIFDRVVVGVVGNPHHKTPMFEVPERVQFVRDALEGVVENVEVDVFSELVVDFARRWDAKAIVKGLRVVSDFEWEFQMNQLNRHRPRHRDRLRDGQRPGELCFLERREGDCILRRKCRRAGAEGCRRAAEGDVPERPRRRSVVRPRVDWNPIWMSSY